MHQVAAAVGVEELWRCRKALYAADLLTPVGYIALGAHIDAALLAPSHAGVLLSLLRLYQGSIKALLEP